jgi:hypothetical protein
LLKKNYQDAKEKEVMVYMKHTHVMKFAHMSDGYLTSASQLQALLWQQFQPAICTAQVQQPQLLLLPASEFPHQ